MYVPLFFYVKKCQQQHIAPNLFSNVYYLWLMSMTMKPFYASIILYDKLLQKEGVCLLFFLQLHVVYIHHQNNTQTKNSVKKYKCVCLPWHYINTLIFFFHHTDDISNIEPALHHSICEFII